MNNNRNGSEQSITKLIKGVDSPDELADQIAEIFDCPITIEDSNHHIIAYSKHSENIDEARISTIMNRKVPDKVINGLWKKGIMPKLIDRDEPVIIPEIKHIGLGNRVAISIRKRNEILGFIWAHTANKTLNEENLQLLKEAAVEMKHFLLKRRQGKRKSEEGYKDFLWQLLTGDIQDTRKISYLANQYNMNLEGKIGIVIFQFPNDVTEQVEKHAYYLSETQVKVKVEARLFDENEFITLVRLRKEEDTSESLTNFIKQFVDKITGQLNILSITGVSGLLYEKAQHIHESYKQAQKMLKLKEIFTDELENIYIYEDLGIYQFIEELHDIQKGQYFNKYIEKIRTYDQKHRTSLLPTLEVYLKEDCNVYQAAQALFIHPNTMNYRLKRIKEVAKLNLKDPNQKTVIYLHLLMEKISKG
ncbi:PucR family transcriptional regulator [Oceanobacillus senegalensis]|uniref:PucR family transcriptional regulator n=1 Tax=Oceanobacillus senegalensis TaxID=1936063 RepID=UPI000A30D95C|nr:helix-turn-helix domain-containing protein [Oceanobacillus senegalensis]